MSTGRRRCYNCPVENWVERPSKRYADRLVVTCKVCGNWIGYRLKEREERKSARRKKSKQATESHDDTLFDSD